MPNTSMPDVNKEFSYHNGPESDNIVPPYMQSQGSVPASQPRNSASTSASQCEAVPGIVATIEDSPEKPGAKLAETLGAKLGIPPSWASPSEVNTLAQNMTDPEALAACVDKLLGQPTQDAPQVNAKQELADDEMTKQEKRLRTAIDSGTFDMTGVLGKAWNQAKKQNIGLAADYLAVGKSYNAQREFRLKWCKMELTKMETIQTEIEENEQSEYSQGEYLPFDVIVDREGGPKRAASVKAALHYALACQRFFKQNHMASSKHFCEYNGMTQRWEFLFLRKGYRENFTKLWKMETRNYSISEVVSDASSSSGEVMASTEALGAGPAAPAAPAAPAQKVDKKVVATPKAKGSKRKAGEPAAEESPDQMAKKVQKKEMDIGFRKLSSLRTRMASSSSTASDIAGYINRDRKWSWAKGDSNEDLKKASS
jgi:hypothetical protein